MNCEVVSKVVIPEDSRLTPLRFSHVKGTHQYWVCRCECGNEKVIRRSHLQRGEIRSCGCLHRELCRDINKRMTRESYLKAGRTRRGRPTCNKGKICVYQFENRKTKGSRRQYLTKTELEEVWRGERELVWD